MAVAFEGPLLQMKKGVSPSLARNRSCLATVFLVGRGLLCHGVNGVWVYASPLMIMALGRPSSLGCQPREVGQFQRIEARNCNLERHGALQAQTWRPAAHTWVPGGVALSSSIASRGVWMLTRTSARGREGLVWLSAWHVNHQNLAMSTCPTILHPKA